MAVSPASTVAAQFELETSIADLGEFSCRTGVPFLPNNAEPARQGSRHNGTSGPVFAPSRPLPYPPVPVDGSRNCLPVFRMRCPTTTSCWWRLESLNQQVEGSIPSRRTNILFPSQGPPGGRSNFSNDVESLSGYLDPMLSWPTGAFAITHGRAYNLHASRSSWSHRGQAPGAGPHCLAGLEPNRPTVEGRALRRHTRWSSSAH